MPAFKRFGPGDQLDNVLVLQPQYNLVSGSLGWRGSPDGSASISLYGGMRRSPAHVVSAVTYQSLYPNARQVGNPVLGLPTTASINVVWMTNETLPLGSVWATRWGAEHFGTVTRLYQDYYAQDPDYTTGSYDYYCLYFNQNSSNIVVDDIQSPITNLSLLPSASFTLESWVKPFTTSSVNSDFTIQSINRNFWFGITGSNGTLMFSSSLGQSVTSSIGVSVARWNHVALSYDSLTRVGSLYLNLQLVGQLMSPSASIAPNLTASVYLSVGNSILSDSLGFSNCTGAARRSFNGFIGEARYWEGARSWSQLSSSAFSRLTGTDIGGPLSLLMFNEGPLSFVNAAPMGSGALDYAGVARGRSAVSTYAQANLVGFNDRVGPVWHPNDNVQFYPTKRCAPAQLSASWGINRSADVSRMLVVDVPSAFYGRQIVPGSVSMTCAAYSAPPYNMVRTLVDDGRGGLYLSGSACSSSLLNREDYDGVNWNKVGNVFYGEGLIVIRDPALLDFGRTDGLSNVPTDTLQLSFQGDSRIPVKTLMCRIDHGEFNCSTNPTFYYTDDNGERLRRHPSGSIRISTVGIYNSDRELVAVARLADPVRKRDRDRLNLKLRCDF